MKNPVYIAIMLFIFFIPLDIFSQTDTNQTYTIAVLDFKNLSQNKGYDFLEKTIPESLTTSLQKSGRVNLVERQRLATLLDEKKLQLTGLVDQDLATGKNIGMLSQADHLILGSFSSIGDSIEVNARLVDVNTGEILLAEKISGKMGDELFGKINELSDSMLAQLFHFDTGTLNLDTTPQGAEVRVNNSLIGVTPIADKKMKAGHYTAVIVKQGYEINNVDFDVRSGKQNNLNFALEKKSENFPYKLGITAHVLQDYTKDFQPDWNLSLSYQYYGFSLGVEAGGLIYIHSYQDTNAPGKVFSDSMVLYNHHFEALLGYHLFSDSKIISPYIGAGLGILLAYNGDYNYSRQDFYWKGIAGITFFPSSHWSPYFEAIYHNPGTVVISQKQFNFFGNYNYTTKNVVMENFLYGIGIQYSF